MLDKTYSPAEIEARLYAAWEESGAFACRPDAEARPYSIVIPPPNVTGSLHMGHALNNTLQDVLIRHRRKQGCDALWQVGMDHAGIATQMVVERQLADEGLDRNALGRNAFIERVWNWKAESGGTIIRQLRRLGASADWARERFTMDEGLSAAVRKVFVELHRAGLIYRDKRLVNWDPLLHTAISDLEVEQREVDGFLWYIKYPIEGSANKYITVATTRPETLFGDTGVAVHPEDPRYADLIGAAAILPLAGRRLPIVGDAYSDPEKGTGAVKITPAHDFNDFELGARHGLAAINVLDASGRMNDEVPEAYRGLDRFAAREAAVAELEALGLLVKTEPHRHVVPHGDRSGSVIEPWLTDQWFVDAETLAKPAIEAVERGDIVFVPKNWEKTYFEWMRNIQPWCVSRQIWWGHQIPAWYGPDGEVFVAMDEAAAAASARAHYGEAAMLTRDADVLDTWFSSALWPFSTLGWPDETPELARYYPTDVLVTGFDIIFFWVARMAMMGLRFMGEVPFRAVYIHALVRDEKGHKMSKSKGNVIDPLELMDRYGADALRFTLASMAAQGRDIKLSEKRVEGYRNFATKLWNAARFCEMNECAPVPAFDPAACGQTVNRWIVGELTRAAEAGDEALDAFRFNDAANRLYQFTWGSFCDWYLELIKPVLYGPEGAARTETRACATWVLDQILHLLHPFMPFITEELWQRLDTARPGALMATLRPTYAEALRHEDAGREMNWIVRLISEVRAVRAEMNVPAAARVPLLVRGAGDEHWIWLESHGPSIEALARVASITPAEGTARSGCVQAVLDEVSLILPLAGVIDLAAEQARLAKEIARLHDEIGKIENKLANDKFVSKAPPEVVEEQRERRDFAERTRARLEEALASLAG